ncbi:MAG: hypothetical protein M3Y89_14220 [Actinomycetota bacterium]|nr:hypothetical protein [Actinomycetota bacterium]
MTFRHRLRLLEVEIELTGDPLIGRAVLAGLGSFAAAAQAAVTATPDGWEVQVGAGSTVGEILAELTRLAVENSPLLCIHSGVVAAPHGTVVIPGTSGLGKTTLVGALVAAGFGYLSDEVLAVDRVGGGLAGFTRPLALAADSWTLLGLDPAGAPGPAQEQLVQPELLGRLGVPAPVREILLAERRPGPPSLQQLARGTAVQATLGRSFNHFRDPAGSFHAVVRLIRQARVWRAGYQDAPELAALLAAHWLAD